MNKTEILSAKNLTKSYPQGGGELVILRGIDLTVYSGETIAIVGPSGSGKSTLMHILGTLDRPNGGELSVLGSDVLALNDEGLARFRNEKMGFVFQFHHLLAEFNALENVALPMRIAGMNKTESFARAEDLLALVGLKDRMIHYPTELSGGELQRVAIARALSRRPPILFADEPTGNLDSKNSQGIQELFFALQEKANVCLIVVTHDLKFAEKFSRVMRLSDGKWVSTLSTHHNSQKKSHVHSFIDGPKSCALVCGLS